MSDNARYQPGARGPPVHAPDPERDFVACQALYLHVQASAQRTQDLYMLTLLRKYFAPVTNGEAQFTHCCTTATGCQLIGALVNDLRGAERYYARREAALVRFSGAPSTFGENSSRLTLTRGARRWSIWRTCTT